MQKLAEICIRRPVFATMLIMCLVVMGFAAYQRLGVDFFPKIDFPTITVTTTLRGAAPEEIETQVSKRIEEAVNTISGIDELRSVSSEGVSQVITTFVLEKNGDIAAQEVRDKISAIVGQLPKDTDPPVVQKLATDATPVLNVVVSSPRDLRETTKLVDDRIKKNIESLNGVGQVTFVGERQRQIQVSLDGEKLYSYNLNIDQVRSALALQNVEIPGGRVDQGSRELSLRTLGRVEHPQDFSRIIVANVGGKPIRIADIGTVLDGVEEPRSLARLDGRPAVLLEVRKQEGSNALEVIRSVKARINQLSSILPADVKITYTRDQSGFIEDSFKAVQEHLIMGGLLASLVVFLFLRNWRSTLITAVAIPTSIVSTYTLMGLMGFTLNQITMLALVLMVGIVIDDAIVVLENIFRFMEEKGLPPMQAAVQGTRDIGLAVLATTLSLAIIFLPIALMSGIVGRFMSSFGYTAAFAIMVSLLVSFTLTPMLCSRFLKPSTKSSTHSTKQTWLFRVTDVPYKYMLRWSMAHRWVIVAVSLAVLVSIVPLFSMVGKDFLPIDDQSEFEVLVRMPPGSSLEGSESAMKSLEAELKQMPGVRNMLTTIGADARRQVDRGSILLELIPFDQRKESQTQLMIVAREKLKRFHDLVFAVQLPSLFQGSGPQSDLQFFLQGPDLNQLEKYTAQLKRELAKVPNVTDIDSSYEAGKPELRVRINRDKASDLSVNVSSVATALRTLVGGDTQVTTYREGDDRYDVDLRVDKEFRTSTSALNRLFVPSGSLGNVPVSNVAYLEEATGPTQIERYNRQRQIMISANFVNGQALSNVIPIIENAVKEMNLPPDYRSGLVGRSKEFGRAVSLFLFAFMLSFAFMYMILAAQFESFIDPITILISLPLSVPFALIALVLTHENFSIIYTSLGILVLFGIVKKNSILQIDHIKSLRADGAPRLEAILQGCEDRLRPILMTTAALVAGMIPLALGGGAGSGSRRTVAIVVIGGQSMCLILTLLVTPVAYSLFDDLAHLNLIARFRKRAAGLKPAAALRSLFLMLLITLSAQSAELPPIARVGVGIAEKKLTLAQAIELALANNLDIEIERATTAKAAQAIRAAQGIFDPNFRFQPGYAANNTPTSSILQGAGGKLNENTSTENFYYRERLPWVGSSLGVDFENGRTSTTNSFASLNPYFNSRLLVSFAVPLLRNREVDRDRNELKIRSKQLDITTQDFETRVIDVITRVEQAYWDLVAAREDVQVQADAVELAARQLAQNNRMIQAGTLAPIELSASQAELERRRDTYLASIGTLTETENNLKMLLLPDRRDEMWSDQIVPTNSSTGDPAESDDVREAVGNALKHRTEMRQVALRKESNKIDQKFNSDQTKPQVNIVSSYSSAGLGGAVSQSDNPFTASNTLLYGRLNQLSAAAGLAPLPSASLGSLPPSLLGGYGTVLSGLFGGNYQSLQVGLALDFTARNRTAQANYAVTLIEAKRLQHEEARTEQIIEAQVRNALQAIQTARQRITAAEASQRAAKEKLDSETRLFQTGESTNFFVLTRQNEFLDSRRRAVGAHLDFNKAVARLEQAVGSTLASHQITLK